MQFAEGIRSESVRHGFCLSITTGELCRGFLEKLQRNSYQRQSAGRWKGT